MDSISGGVFLQVVQRTSGRMVCRRPGAILALHFRTFSCVIPFDLLKMLPLPSRWLAHPVDKQEPWQFLILLAEYVNLTNV
jgi:hypothetical protein